MQYRDSLQSAVLDFPSLNLINILKIYVESVFATRNDVLLDRSAVFAHKK